MQRNRKMTLNEEFALMRKMFHKMGVTEVLKENKIRLYESLGGPTPTVFDGFTPGSSVAIIGKTVLPEIESAILMSAKNSDLIMTSLGKRVGDNLTFDDIVNSGIMGATKKEVAQNIVTQLGEGGVTLMKNLGDILGGANSTSLKNQIAELSNEPQRQVQSKLQNIQKQIDVPDQATKAANLETVADLLPGLRNAVDSDISLTATQKTAINELFDSLEAQANAYKTKSSDVFELDPAIQKTINELQEGNYSSIRNVMNSDPDVTLKLSDGEITSLKNAVDNMSDEEINKVFDDLVVPVLKNEKPKPSSGGGYLYSGLPVPPDVKIERVFAAIHKFIAGVFGIIPTVLNSTLGKLKPGTRTVIVWILVVAAALYLGYQAYNYFVDGGFKRDVKDTITADSKDEDCVEAIIGYNDLNSDQQKFAVVKYGCKETKNNTTNPVKSFGVDPDTECLIAVRQDNTSEKWKVTAGGAGEPCGGNNVIPPPNNSCKCTLQTMTKELDDSGIVYSNPTFDTTSCTGSYVETVEYSDGTTDDETQTYNCPL